MTHERSPDTIVRDGGRQLLSGHYDSLLAQLRPTERIIALLRTDTGFRPVNVERQDVIDGLCSENAPIEGFFAVPVSYA